MLNIWKCIDLRIVNCGFTVGHASGNLDLNFSDIQISKFPSGNPWLELSAYTSQGFPLGKSLGRSVCLYEPRISPGEILGSMYNCPDSKNFRLNILFLLEFDLNFARIVQSVI